MSIAGSAPVASLPPPTATAAAAVSVASGLVTPPPVTPLLLMGLVLLLMGLLLLLMGLVLLTMGLVLFITVLLLIGVLAVGTSTGCVGGLVTPPVGDKAAFAAAVAATVAGPLGSCKQAIFFRALNIII